MSFWSHLCHSIFMWLVQIMLWWEWHNWSHRENNLIATFKRQSFVGFLAFIGKRKSTDKNITRLTTLVFNKNLNKQRENNKNWTIFVWGKPCFWLTVTSASILKSLPFGFMTTDTQFRRKKFSSHISSFLIIILIQITCLKIFPMWEKSLVLCYTVTFLFITLVYTEWHMLGGELRF